MYTLGKGTVLPVGSQFILAVSAVQSWVNSVLYYIISNVSALIVHRSAICDTYMLEFHSSLAIATQLPAALKHAYWVG